MGHVYDDLFLEIPPIAANAKDVGDVDFSHDILCVQTRVPWTDALIQACEQSGRWTRSAESVNESSQEVTQKRRSSQMILSRRTDPRLGRFEDAVGIIINRGLQLYMQHNPYFRVTSHCELSVLKYMKGDGYGEHVDVYTPTKVPRVLSALFYLNHDYEGGALVFPRQNREHRLPSGSLVIFPSIGTHPHAAAPVTNGTRYVVVTWAS